MTWWNEVMQDDCYLISGTGWLEGARVREIVKIKTKDGKSVWPEPGDYQIGRRKFVSDLIPSRLVITRFFAAEQAQIDALDARITELEQELQDRIEEGGGEDGLLAEVIEGEGDKQKITAKAIKARLKDDIEPEERKALKDYLTLIDQHAKARNDRSVAEARLNDLVHAKYPALSDDEVKALVIDDKWLAKLEGDVQAELERVSQRLTGRVKELAERYATPLPKLQDDVAELVARVARHLQAMGLSA